MALAKLGKIALLIILALLLLILLYLGSVAPEEEIGENLEQTSPTKTLIPTATLLKPDFQATPTHSTQPQSLLSISFRLWIS